MAACCGVPFGRIGHTWAVVAYVTVVADTESADTVAVIHAESLAGYIAVIVVCRLDEVVTEYTVADVTY